MSEEINGYVKIGDMLRMKDFGNGRVQYWEEVFCKSPSLKDWIENPEWTGDEFDIMHLFNNQPLHLPVIRKPNSRLNNCPPKWLSKWHQKNIPKLKLPKNDNKNE